MIINERIKYNNAMIQLFRGMLETNYHILGITKDEAIALSKKLTSSNHKEVRKSIKEIKDVVGKNAQKYRKGNMYDLRELGLGVMFMTDENIGEVANSNSA